MKAIDLATMSKEEVREFITKVEAMISLMEQIEVPLKHYFSKGVYAREVTIAKGSFLIGKIHKHQNLNILSKGEITVFSIEGYARIKAPCTMVSPPGVKRVVYAHEDCVWTTIHGTDETDLVKIEEQFIVKSYEELESPEETKWLG